MWIFDDALEFIGSGSNLNVARADHGCNVVYSTNHNGRQVIIVAGGNGNFADQVRSVELLDYSAVSGSSWETC